MILITGATSGIGEACAEIFAAQKHSLFLVGRRQEKLQSLKESLEKKYSITVHITPLDVQNPSEIEKFFQENKNVLKNLNGLINNAGLAKGLGPTHSLSFSDISAMIDTNFKAVVYFAKMVMPIFIEKKSGHIINVGSVAGHHVYPNGNVYCATKSAVRAMTQALRYDLSGTGVRVSEVSPGMVNTNFSTVRLGDVEKANKVYEGMTPLLANDIAETISWIYHRPKHINIEEIVIYPTDQASPTVVNRVTK
ncbi:MAG: SDR family NAD(P)-dependent oxidoreductase [Bacteriovoracaceae bacterium]|nr:SDR family NAD(P)-dependent oxidoreductase [Bacteriovoracaceae bacterium]